MAEEAIPIGVLFEGNATGLNEAIDHAMLKMKEFNTQLSSMATQQAKVSSIASTTSQRIAQQSVFLNSLYGSGSQIMEKRYLTSVSGLQRGLARAREEFSKTIVVNKGVATSLADPVNRMKQLQIQADMVARTVDNLNTRWTNFGKQSQWVGRQLMVGVTASIAGLGALAVKSFLDIEGAAKQAAVVVGQQAMPALMKSAKETAASWGASTQDMITNMAQLQKALGTSPAQTKALGDLAAGFSQLGNVDLSKTTNMVQKIYAATGSLKETTQTVQTLGIISQNTNINFSKMVDTIPNALPIFRQFGINVGQGASLLAAFEQNGVDATTGLNALRMALMRMGVALGQQGTQLKPLREELIAIQKQTGKSINFFDKNGQIDAMQGLGQLAGVWQQLSDRQKNFFTQLIGMRSGGAAMVPLLNSLGNAYGTISNTANGAIASVSDFAKAQKLATQDPKTIAENWNKVSQAFKSDPAEMFKEIKQQLLQVGADIGSQLMPYVLEFAKWIERILKWVDGLSVSTKKWITEIALVAASIGPVVYAFGQLNVLASTVSKFALIGPITSILKLKTRPAEKLLGEGGSGLVNQMLLGKNNTIDTGLQDLWTKIEQKTGLSGQQKASALNAMHRYAGTGKSTSDFSLLNSELKKAGINEQLELKSEQKNTQALDTNTLTLRKVIASLERSNEILNKRNKPIHTTTPLEQPTSPPFEEYMSGRYGSRYDPRGRLPGFGPSSGWTAGMRAPIGTPELTAGEEIRALEQGIGVPGEPIPMPPKGSGTYIHPGGAIQSRFGGRFGPKIGQLDKPAEQAAEAVAVIESIPDSELDKLVVRSAKSKARTATQTAPSKVQEAKKTEAVEPKAEAVKPSRKLKEAVQSVVIPQAPSVSPEALQARLTKAENALAEGQEKFDMGGIGPSELAGLEAEHKEAKSLWQKLKSRTVGQGESGAIVPSELMHWGFGTEQPIPAKAFGTRPAPWAIRNVLTSGTQLEQQRWLMRAIGVNDPSRNFGNLGGILKPQNKLQFASEISPAERETRLAAAQKEQEEFEAETERQYKLAQDTRAKNRFGKTFFRPMTAEEEQRNILQKSTPQKVRHITPTQISFLKEAKGLQGLTPLMNIGSNFIEFKPEDTEKIQKIIADLEVAKRVDAKGAPLKADLLRKQQQMIKRLMDSIQDAAPSLVTLNEGAIGPHKTIFNRLYSRIQGARLKSAAGSPLTEGYSGPADFVKTAFEARSAVPSPGPLGPRAITPSMLTELHRHYMLGPGSVNLTESKKAREKAMRDLESKLRKVRPKTTLFDLFSSELTDAELAKVEKIFDGTDAQVAKIFQARLAEVKAQINPQGQLTTETSYLTKPGGSKDFGSHTTSFAALRKEARDAELNLRSVQQSGSKGRVWNPETGKFESEVDAARARHTEAQTRLQAARKFNSGSGYGLFKETRGAETAQTTAFVKAFTDTYGGRSTFTGGELHQAPQIEAVYPQLLKFLGIQKQPTKAKLKDSAALLKKIADPSIKNIKLLQEQLPKELLDIILANSVGGMSSIGVDKYLKQALGGKEVSYIDSAGKEAKVFQGSEEYQKYAQSTARAINDMAEEVAKKHGFSGSQLESFSQRRASLRDLSDSRQYEAPSEPHVVGGLPSRTMSHWKDSEGNWHTVEQPEFTGPTRGSGSDFIEQEAADRQAALSKETRAGARKRKADIRAITGIGSEERDAFFKDVTNFPKVTKLDQFGNEIGAINFAELGQGVKDSIKRFFGRFKKTVEELPSPLQEVTPNRILKFKSGKYASGSGIVNSVEQGVTQSKKPTIASEVGGGNIARDAEGIQIALPSVTKDAIKIEKEVKGFAGVLEKMNNLPGFKTLNKVAGSGSKLGSILGKVGGLGQSAVEGQTGMIFSGAEGGLSTVMGAAGPILIVIAAIAAAIAVIIIKWNDIKKGVGNGLKELKAAFKEFISTIISPFKSILNEFGIMGSTSKGTASDMKKTWKDLGTILNAIFHVLAQGLKLLGAILKPVMQYLAGTLGFVMHSGQVVIALFSGDWPQAMKAMKAATADMAKGVIDMFIGIVTGALGMLQSIVKLGSHIPGVGRQFKGLANDIKDVRKEMGTWGQDVADMISPPTPAAVKAAKTLADVFAAEYKTELKSQLDAGKSADDAQKIAQDYINNIAAIMKVGGIYIGADFSKSFAKQLAEGGLGADHATKVAQDYLKAVQADLDAQHIKTPTVAQLDSARKDAAQQVGDEITSLIQANLNQATIEPPPIDTSAPQEDLTGFVSTFQTEMQKVMEADKKAAEQAFADGVKRQTDAIDAKTKAIDDQIKALQDHQAELQKDNTLADDANKIAELGAQLTVDRNSDLASGLYSDAMNASLKYGVDIADAQKKLGQDQQAATAKAQEDQLNVQKEALANEKTALQEQLDAQKQALDDQLTQITQFTPKTAAEAATMQDAITQALRDHGADTKTVSQAIAGYLPNAWQTALDNTVKSVQDTNFWSNLQKTMDTYSGETGMSAADQFMAAFTGKDPNAVTSSGTAASGTANSGPDNNNNLPVPNFKLNLPSGTDIGTITKNSPTDTIGVVIEQLQNLSKLQTRLDSSDTPQQYKNIMNQMIPILQELKSDLAMPLSPTVMAQIKYALTMSTAEGIKFHYGGAVGVGEIPAVLQTGEFVLRREAVSAIGLNSLNALNRAPKMHSGGIMGPGLLQGYEGMLSKQVSNWLGGDGTIKGLKIHGGPVSLDIGGIIDSDGIAKVHKGEAVVSNALQQKLGGDTNLTVECHFDGGFFGTDANMQKLADTLSVKLIPLIDRKRGLEPRKFSSFK